MSWILIAPLRVPQTKTKLFTIGMNQYRNAHYQVLNKVKIEYKNIMKEQILKLPEFSKVSIDYTLYPRTKHLCDISNILSIHDKFFCDALVELGKLPEDNYLFVPRVVFNIGHIDSNNSRVEIKLIDYEET